VATSFVERASFIYCSFDSAPEIRGVGVRGCSGYAIILCAFLQDGVWAILVQGALVDEDHLVYSKFSLFIIKEKIF